MQEALKEAKIALNIVVKDGVVVGIMHVKRELKAVILCGEV